jgi:hypothetical protein
MLTWLRISRKRSWHFWQSVCICHHFGGTILSFLRDQIDQLLPARGLHKVQAVGSTTLYLQLVSEQPMKEVVGDVNTH